MTPEQADRLKFLGQALAREIDPQLPPGVGFALILAPFETDECVYTSSANRAGMASALRKLLKTWESDGIIPPDK